MISVMFRNRTESQPAEFTQLIPAALSADLRPSAGGYGSYGLGVIGEEVPGVAADLDDVVGAVEDGDGELVGAR